MFIIIHSYIFLLIYQFVFNLKNNLGRKVKNNFLLFYIKRILIFNNEKKKIKEEESMKKLISLIFLVTYSQVFCSSPLAFERVANVITSPHQQTVEQLNVIEDILDNSLCKNGAVWRPFGGGEGTIKGIVIHYTVTQTYELTKRAYYNAGVSANYTVDFNGNIFKNVPDGAMTFHSGISAYDEDISLNRFFIGIEQVHPGYIEKGVKYTVVWNNYGLLSYCPGDDKTLWFKFFKEQYEATGKLVRQLQLKNRICGRLVVTHADVAPGRKVDAGPMFPYRLIFEKYKAGYYPSFDKIEAYIPLLSFLQYEDFLGLLGVYGYDFSLPTRYLKDYEEKIKAYEIEKEAYEKDREGKVEPKKPRMPNVPKQEGYEKFVLGSFRLHFCSDLKELNTLSSFGNVSELHSKELSDLEKMVILCLSIGYYHYEDENLGYDMPFRAKLEAFANDPVRKARMEGFISLLK